MKLRDSISAILKTPVGSDWDTAITKINEKGGITNKALLDMVVTLCKKTEEIESALVGKKILDAQANAELPKSEEKSVFNPLATDLTIGYKDDENKDQSVTLLSQQISTHPIWLADILTNRLADALANERQLNIITDADRAELKKEIEVKL